jgi:homoserine dehydrogenase
MQNEDREFEDVLKEAQAKGYAEADPTNDVDGFDTSYKISILASIAFGRQVPIDKVYREGIRRVTKLDMAYAKMLGYRIKLLGIVDAVTQKLIRVRVHPTLIKSDHQIAHVDGVFNALWLRGDYVGDLMFSGRGAGSDPTASAVVGDLIDVGRNIASGGQGSAIPYGEGMATEPIDTLVTPYYLRLLVSDRPMVLSVIATAFGRNEVSLSAMEMKTLDGGTGEIVFLTHPCQESNFRRALEEIGSQDVVRLVANSFRVHESE